MRNPRHPVRGRQGRVVFHRERAPTPEELARLAAARKRARRTPWSHIRDVALVLLEGNAPERVMLSWQLEGPDPSGADPSALAELVTRIGRALPGARVLVDDPLALFSRHGARFLASPNRGTRPDRLPTGWRPRPGTIQHQGRRTRRQAPPATRGQLVDFLGVLDASPDRELDVVGLAAGPALHPRFALRHGIQQGILAAAGLRALTALADARIIPPTGLPELALQRLHDGDVRERRAARRLLETLDELPRPSRSTTRPRLAQVGQTLRRNWTDCAGPSSSRRPTGAPITDTPGWGTSRARQALHQTLPPILEPPPDHPWPGRPTEHLLPYLTRGERLAQVLRSDASDRRTGALALLAVGGPTGGVPAGCFDAVTAILEATSSSPLEASLAAIVLGRFDAPEAARRLARVAMEAPDPDVAQAAAEALAGQAGPEAREALRDAIGRPRVAPVAAEVASLIGDVGSLESILTLSEDADATSRTAAARALARIGTGPSVQARLDALAQDPSPRTARAARASRAVHRSLPELRAWARSAPATDLAAALELLGRRDRTDAWPVIRAGLSHSSPDVRAASAAGLGWLGLPGATPILVRTLADLSTKVAVAACLALARCGDERAVEPLRRLARGAGSACAAAHRALRAGRFLRTPAPDDRILLRALSPAPLPLVVAGRLTTALQAPGLRCRVSAAGVSGEATVDADDIPGLIQLTEALDRAATECPDLRWSVRDGQHALRRHGRRWSVSRRRGRVVRDAGWFEEPARATPARPPLSPKSDEDDLLLTPEPTPGGADDLVLDDDLLLDDSDDDDLELDDDLVVEPLPENGLSGLRTGRAPTGPQAAPPAD